jgi:ribosomal protein S18 acetylase RimI-like enzyme
MIGYRPPAGRMQMLMRRGWVVQMDPDPPSDNWWEACAAADFDYTKFTLIPRGGHEPVGFAKFRSTELYGSNLERSLGLVDVDVQPDFRRRGAATFLLGESFRQLSQQGTRVVEAQASKNNRACLGLLAKLGFSQVSQGAVFRKNVVS